MLVTYTPRVRCLPWLGDATNGGRRHPPWVGASRRPSTAAPRGSLAPKEMVVAELRDKAWLEVGDD
jgi:hypothetical protein